MKEVFQVTGMTCSACSAHVERAVAKVPGVESVAVNLMTGRMHVVFHEKLTSVDAICSAVVAEGYGARRAETDDAGRHGESYRVRIRTAVGGDGIVHGRHHLQDAGRSKGVVGSQIWKRTCLTRKRSIRTAQSRC